jgi:hypothetical protein
VIIFKANQARMMEISIQFCLSFQVKNFLPSSDICKVPLVQKDKFLYLLCINLDLLNLKKIDALLDFN